MVDWKRAGFCLVVLLGVAACTRAATPAPVTYGGKTAAEWLMQLRDLDWSRKNEASAALQRMGAEAVPVLLDSLDSRDRRTQMEAQLALAAQCSDVIPLLQKAEEETDRSDTVRLQLIEISIKYARMQAALPAEQQPEPCRYRQ